MAEIEPATRFDSESWAGHASLEQAPETSVAQSPQCWKKFKMVFWIFLVIALLLTTCFLLQSLVMYSYSRIKRRQAKHSGGQHGVLLPELVALEAQFFLAPKRALVEARELLTSVGVPDDCLAKVSDQASFSKALQQSQAFLACQGSAAVKAARTTPSK